MNFRWELNQKREDFKAYDYRFRDPTNNIDMTVSTVSADMAACIVAKKNGGWADFEAALRNGAIDRNSFTVVRLN